jgi:hypothetical protein
MHSPPLFDQVWVYGRAFDAVLSERLLHSRYKREHIQTHLCVFQRFVEKSVCSFFLFADPRLGAYFLCVIQLSPCFATVCYALAEGACWVMCWGCGDSDENHIPDPFGPSYV